MFALLPMSVLLIVLKHFANTSSVRWVALALVLTLLSELVLHYTALPGACQVAMYTSRDFAVTLGYLKSGRDSNDKGKIKVSVVAEESPGPEVRPQLPPARNCSQDQARVVVKQEQQSAAIAYPSLAESPTLYWEDEDHRYPSETDTLDETTPLHIRPDSRRIAGNGFPDRVKLELLGYGDSSDSNSPVQREIATTALPSSYIPCDRHSCSNPSSSPMLADITEDHSYEDERCLLNGEMERDFETLPPPIDFELDWTDDVQCGHKYIIGSESTSRSPSPLEGSQDGSLTSRSHAFCNGDTSPSLPSESPSEGDVITCYQGPEEVTCYRRQLSEISEEEEEEESQIRVGFNGVSHIHRLRSNEERLGNHGDRFCGHGDRYSDPGDRHTYPGQRHTRSTHEQPKHFRPEHHHYERINNTDRVRNDSENNDSDEFRCAAHAGVTCECMGGASSGEARSNGESGFYSTSTEPDYVNLVNGHSLLDEIILIKENRGTSSPKSC